MVIFTPQANHDTENERSALREIVNGSSVLPELIFQKLKAFNNFQYLERTRVTGLNQTLKQVSFLRFDWKT